MGISRFLFFTCRLHISHNLSNLNIRILHLKLIKQKLVSSISWKVIKFFIPERVTLSSFHTGNYKLLILLIPQKCVLIQYFYPSKNRAKLFSRFFQLEKIARFSRRQISQLLQLGIQSCEYSISIL